MVTTASGSADIWGDLVVFHWRAKIAMVNLRTGEDRLVFESGNHAYFMPAVSSHYVVARKSFREPDRWVDDVVARSLDDLSGPEILLGDLERQNGIAVINIYEEWVTWLRFPPTTGVDELVLFNIETGEERILDVSYPGHGIRAGGIWGDRVVWGQRDEIKGETLVEHRISTNTTRDVLTDPSLAPMLSTSVWEHYAVFNHQPYFNDWNAMLVDLDTGEVRQITPSGSNQDQARINGGRVIWTDFRTGIHVYVYSLRTGQEYIINPSARGSSEPLIFGQNVVWGGDWEGYNGPPWVTRIGDI
jgi:beta propeller repeat protein